MSYLTKKEIKEFRRLIIKHKDIKLTEAEALEQGSRLVMLFEARMKFELVPLSGLDAVESTAKSGKKK